jgi:hypothetical protein
MGKEAEKDKLPKLEIRGFDPNANILRVEIENTGGSVARNCYGKITIEHADDDVVYGHTPAFITPKFLDRVEGMSLCWAVSEKETRNIPRGGKEMLMIARVESYPPPPSFNIPSDNGFGINLPVPSVTDLGSQWVEKKSRVFLKPKNYTGTLTVGSEDLLPVKKKFKLVYDDKTNTADLVLLPA